MKAAIIGLGLIGGSLAYDLQQLHWIKTIVGVEKDAINAKVALRLGIVPEIETFEQAVKTADLIILAIPVNVVQVLLPKVLDLVKKDAVVVDLGSTKNKLINCVKNHINRSRYVAAHPMAGTEYSGPQAALKGLFKKSICILCEIENSDKDAIIITEKMFRDIGMNIKYMSAKQHDLHAAYVSHISHISSFVLAETVLDKEKDEQAIFDMAAGGFSSTVRLAKSSPDMWMPIFKQNAENLSEVLNTYIKNMVKFREMINEENEEGLLNMMKKANNISKIIK